MPFCEGAHLGACYVHAFQFSSQCSHCTPMESSHIVAVHVIWHDILLTVLSLITLVFLGLFIQEMRRGRGPMIESNWGGIGGGGGGWRMSSSLAYLLGMFGIATLLVIVLVHSPGDTPQDEKKASASPTPSAASTTVTPTPTPTAAPTPSGPAAKPTP